MYVVATGITESVEDGGGWVGRSTPPLQLKQ